jgi:hypothetical protein
LYYVDYESIADVVDKKLGYRFSTALSLLGKEKEKGASD